MWESILEETYLSWCRKIHKNNMKQKSLTDFDEECENIFKNGYEFKRSEYKKKKSKMVE